MRKHLLSMLFIMATGTPALAQHGQHEPHAQGHHSPHGQHGQHGTSHHSPYGGMQAREIKAFSAQQIADLKAGKGMGFAIPAELNGYPGPAHVLELAEPLGLSEEQKRVTEKLFARMQDEAKALGEQWVAAERALDQLFSARKADVTSVQAASAAAAQAQGALRAAHLRYHLEMIRVLDAAQVARYQELRGYR